MSRLPSAGHLRPTTFVGANVLMGLALAATPVRADEAASGVYVAASVAGASHRDVAILDWTDPPSSYIDLDLNLRLGAAWNGTVGGLALDYGGMIGRPGAAYVALFGGYGGKVSRRWILELTGELGLHFFHDVGSLAGTYDVVQENGARLPFWGVRLTASSPRARWRWQPAFFVALRADVGHETVSSTLRMTCPSFGFPDGPECHEGSSSAAQSSVGGITLMAGFELRGIFQGSAEGRSGAPRETP